MGVDDRIKQLVTAGMKIKLTQDNVDALSQLSEAQVKQLVSISKGLGKGGGVLVLTDFPSIQPPTM